VILITQKDKLLPEINAVQIRDNINKAVAKRAIVKVEVSKRGNLVLTTKEAILPAKTFLEDQQQWQQVFDGWPITKASLPETWYKLVAHGVPNGPMGLAQFAEDCTTDNPIQKVLGQPRWLKTPEEGYSGSVVFAVSTEAEANTCLRRGLYTAGIRARVDRYRAFSATTLCRRCSGLGHNPETCRARPRCKYCSGGHYSSSHCCRECKASQPCRHMPAKCSHCPSAHESGSQECAVVQALRPTRPRPTQALRPPARPMTQALLPLARPIAQAPLPMATESTTIEDEDMQDELQ
jgi:hypothetical protein